MLVSYLVRDIPMDDITWILAFVSFASLVFAVYAFRKLRGRLKKEAALWLPNVPHSFSLGPADPGRHSSQEPQPSRNRLPCAMWTVAKARRRSSVLSSRLPLTISSMTAARFQRRARFDPRAFGSARVNVRPSREAVPPSQPRRFRQTARRGGSRSGAYACS